MIQSLALLTILYVMLGSSPTLINGSVVKEWSLQPDISEEIGFSFRTEDSNTIDILWGNTRQSYIDWASNYEESELALVVPFNLELNNSLSSDYEPTIPDNQYYISDISNKIVDRTQFYNAISNSNNLYDFLTYSENDKKYVYQYFIALTTDSDFNLYFYWGYTSMASTYHGSPILYGDLTSYFGSFTNRASGFSLINNSVIQHITNLNNGNNLNTLYYVNNMDNINMATSDFICNFSQNNYYYSSGMVASVGLAPLNQSGSSLYYGLSFSFATLSSDLINNISGGQYNNGYNNGYEDGYNNGIIDGGKQNQNLFSLISQAFTPLVNVLGFEIAPGFTIGLLILVPVALGILLFIIKLITA